MLCKLNQAQMRPTLRVTSVEMHEKGEKPTTAASQISLSQYQYTESIATESEVAPIFSTTAGEVGRFELRRFQVSLFCIYQVHQGTLRSCSDQSGSLSFAILSFSFSSSSSASSKIFLTPAFAILAPLKASMTLTSSLSNNE